MTSEGRSGYQTAHAVVRREVRASLLAGAERNESIGFGSVAYVAAAALYALLLEHAVDRRGCCCSCRRPGALVGRRRRRCRIYLVAQQWLGRSRPRQLVPSLATELGLTVPVPPMAGAGRERPGLTVIPRPEKPADGAPADLNVTQPLTQAGPESDEWPTNPQSPAVSPSALLPADSPGRDSRPWITAGPGSSPRLTPGLAMAHSSIQDPPVAGAGGWRWPERCDERC